MMIVETSNINITMCSLPGGISITKYCITGNLVANLNLGDQNLGESQTKSTDDYK